MKKDESKREGFPDYFWVISRTLMNEILKDSPINDFWHYNLINALYTLIDYDLETCGEILPISVEDIARILLHIQDGDSEEFPEEFLAEISKGIQEIRQWDKENGENILGPDFYMGD